MSSWKAIMDCGNVHLSILCVLMMAADGLFKGQISSAMVRACMTGLAVHA